MNEQQPISPRRRLQELQAIPDSLRTDAEWDELNELEILLAPGNRELAPDNGIRRNVSQPNSQHQQRPRETAGQANSQQKPREGAGPAKKPFRKFHKRPAKPNPE